MRTVGKKSTVHEGICSRKRSILACLFVEGSVFEGVGEFTYLGITVSICNRITDEIQTRTVNGNRAYYLRKGLFTSSLISRNAKLKLYDTLIRPVVIYTA